MPFWTYLLHCRAGKLYTGHTDDLERRVAEHTSGMIPGFTRDLAPVELVWSQEFSTRGEALDAERRIKGWSRAKKLALVRGDWERISVLARSKGSPSTSSGRTVVEVEMSEPSASSGRAGSRGGSQTLTGTLAATARLDKALADCTDLSRERIKALIAQGMVEIDGQLATSPSVKAQAGSSFSIHILPPENPQAFPQDIPITVVYEDEHLIVVDKPAGMVVHPAAGNLDGTLVNALLHHCAQSGHGQLSGIGGVARPGIVHRIDKDTSGLLVVAKSDKAHEGLAAQFADHSLERAYFAICGGHPNPAKGTINERIGRSDANRKKMAVLPKDSSRGKHAVTHYKTIKRLNHCALIECRLETGRTHQVRVHLASIGHALLGDPAYGRTPAPLRSTLKALNFHRQALHAATLGFIHPVDGNALTFSSEIPADMRELIDETGH